MCKNITQCFDAYGVQMNVWNIIEIGVVHLEFTQSCMERYSRGEIVPFSRSIGRIIAIVFCSKI